MIDTPHRLPREIMIEQTEVYLQEALSAEDLDMVFLLDHSRTESFSRKETSIFV
jgi:hypothetical protein